MYVFYQLVTYGVRDQGRRHREATTEPNERKKIANDLYKQLTIITVPAI